jgi:hypothetical protein
MIYRPDENYLVPRPFRGGTADLPLSSSGIRDPSESFRVPSDTRGLGHSRDWSTNSGARQCSAGQDSVKTAANSRQESVYKLTQQGFSAKNELATANVKSPIPKFEHLQDPHSVGSYELKGEIALRVTALEALDKMASEHPQEIKKLLEEIADQQPEPTLQFLVRISLDGIYSNRPGKLKRTIDAMILEKEKL